jgi:hypothetical protein
LLGTARRSGFGKSGETESATAVDDEGKVKKLKSIRLGNFSV